MNILLPVESVVLSYILLLLFPFDQVMNTQAIQNNILYDERLEKRQKMSCILEKSVVATYCCSAHFGHCRILLLEAEDSDVSLETGQSSPQLHLLNGFIQPVLGLFQYRKPRSM